MLRGSPNTKRLLRKKHEHKSPFIKIGENNDGPISYAEAASTTQKRPRGSPRLPGLPRQPINLTDEEEGRLENQATGYETYERPLPQRVPRQPRRMPTQQERGAGTEGAQQGASRPQSVPPVPQMGQINHLKREIIGELHITINNIFLGRGRGRGRRRGRGRAEAEA